MSRVEIGLTILKIKIPCKSGYYMVWGTINVGAFMILSVAAGKCLTEQALAGSRDYILPTAETSYFSSMLQVMRNFTNGFGKAVYSTIGIE